MKLRTLHTALLSAILAAGSLPTADACTRVLHVTKDHRYVITGRNMDWYVRYPTSFWAFPRGMERSGMTPKNPARWVSRYGSVTIVQQAGGQYGATDGMNEKGLVANLLYLTETQYPKRDPTKKGIATSIYIQYLLDNFATVAEAVRALEKGDTQIVPVPIPNSDHLPTMHISISDATGDSAIVEFLNGKMVIHHSPKYQVMTNSPIFEKQLALTEYWNEVGGDVFLPGTRRSADRFVRADFYNRHLPEPKDYDEAIAGVMSIMRNTSSPFGAPDPNKPNISMTQWRVIHDQKGHRIFFESTVRPNVVWVDLNRLDFSKDAPVRALEMDQKGLNGDVTARMKTTKPFEYARP